MNPRSPDSEIRLYLLGPFRLARDSRAVRLPRRKVESLLAYLVLQPEPHPRKKLAALFWGDSSDVQARHSLRTALATLRQHLGGEILLSEQDAIQLNPSISLWVDAREFEQMANRKSQTANGEEAMRHLQSAVNHYADLLPDFHDDWILSERQQYRNLYLDALLRLTQELRSQSKYERAIEFAQKAIAADPGNERACRHLMFCYLVTGNKEAAVREYERCARVLRNELSAEPTRDTTALYHWVKQSAESKALEARITNLPIALSSFVGRKHETASVKRLVSENRLVTLTGAGGSGKTRLAIQVATDLIDAFQDGVWWVELAALTDESLVPQAIAQALGVPESPNEPFTETLCHFVAARQMLLVLDNCEHLITAAMQLVAMMLNVSRNLKVLTTSRERLNVPGELTWLVPSLTLPDAIENTPVQELSEFEAIRLFVERAQSAPRFTLTNENAAMVAQICQRLDGMPLAIELAAARARVLSIAQIASRLDNVFELLTRGSPELLPRQQTLRATIEWSYDLLSGPERTLFRRLAVFAGGFTLKAAELVCASDETSADQILDLLSGLVEKSLVIAEPSQEESRFRMLETIRQYGHEKLLESGEGERTRDRHLDFFYKLIEEADSKLYSGDETVWLERLEAEHDNLRAAFEWVLLKNDPDACLKFAYRMRWFLWVRGHLREGKEFVARAMGKSEGASKSARAQALLAFGLFRLALGEYEQADLNLQESFALSEEMDDAVGVGSARYYLAISASWQGDQAKAIELLEQDLIVWRKLGDKTWIAAILQNIASYLLSQHELTKALGVIGEALAIWREIGNQRGIGRTMEILAEVTEEMGNYREALQLNIEALSTLLEIRDKWSYAQCLITSASITAALRHFEPAARILGAAEALRQSMGYRLPRTQQINQEQTTALIRSALADSQFQAAWNEGRRMTMQQAVQYAMADHSRLASRHAAKEEFGGLTVRERAVAALVAQGKSNRDIAEALVVSERTVGAHVGNILSKLEFSSRTQIATWVISQGIKPGN